jgi:benzoyl-CoA 2,3-dioxygenase component B
MPDGLHVDYDGLIPNNVGLNADLRVRKALETWHPGYLDWWKDMGPEGFQEALVYLRTAVSVDAKGWAKFDFVRMPDYKWGILLAPPVEGRKIPFGQHIGEPVWQDVPGEYRAMLRRLLVIQGDTEPASVEQQRHLGKTAPSLYDLRNLFQVNVEEGRHLWAMVYLLQKYFGADGREEAAELLRRRSGDRDTPRMLGAFNEATPDWLSFFMFTTFTDRDGKMQLAALAQSGFDPLSRTCRFMLTEEAHHMFVGDTGIARVVRRTLEVMRELGSDDPETVRAAGAIDLPTIQRYLNFWFSSSLDLFGADASSNAASYFANGIKGRPDEKRFADHIAAGTTFDLEMPAGAEGTRIETIPMRNAMNEVVRNAYVDDCMQGLTHWNRILAAAGHAYRFSLPSTRFRRGIGSWANVPTDPAGARISQQAYDALLPSWLPSAADRAFVASVMQPVTEPGKMASWIAPPDKGIKDRPVDYEYVRLA